LSNWLLDGGPLTHCHDGKQLHEIFASVRMKYIMYVDGWIMYARCDQIIDFVYIDNIK